MVETYGELVKDLRDGMTGLYIGEGVSMIARELNLLRLDIGREQKEAISVLLDVNKDTLVAINTAKAVVRSIENLCKSTKLKLASGENGEAVKMFLASSSGLEKDVQNAINILTKVIEDSLQGKTNFLLDFATSSCMYETSPVCAVKRYSSKMVVISESKAYHDLEMTLCKKKIRENESCYCFRFINHYFSLGFNS